MKDDLLLAGGQVAVCGGLIFFALWDNLAACFRAVASGADSVAHTLWKCCAMGFVALGWRKRMLVASRSPR